MGGASHPNLNPSPIPNPNPNPNPEPEPEPGLPDQPAGGSKRQRVGEVFDTAEEAAAAYAVACRRMLLEEDAEDEEGEEGDGPEGRSPRRRQHRAATAATAAAAPRRLAPPGAVPSVCGQASAAYLWQSA